MSKSNWILSSCDLKRTIFDEKKHMPDWKGKNLRRNSWNPFCSWLSWYTYLVRLQILVALTQSKLKLHRDVYRIATLKLLLHALRARPSPRLPRDICSGWHNQWHSFPYNYTIVCNSLTATVKLPMVYFQLLPNAAECSTFNWILRKIKFATRNNKRIVGLHWDNLPHLCRFGRVNANEPNAAIRWFACSQMPKPNGLDCGHCDLGVREHHDSIAIVRHAIMKYEMWSSMRFSLI